MNPSEFFLPMIPPKVTNQMHRIIADPRGHRPRFYDPPELAEARAKFLSHLSVHAPAEKLSGPVRLLVIWCFPAEGKHRHGEFKTSKPDTDNLDKLLKDCMTRVGFWKDDAQVAREIIEKMWSNQPGIFIKVSAIEQEER